jgi:hypothetical protein
VSVRPDEETASLLAERYGGRRSGPSRVGVAAIVAVVAGLALLAWVGWGIMRVPVRTQDTGFEIVDESAIDVSFVVVRDPGSTVACRVRALGASFAEVGAADVTVGPSGTRAVEVTTRVATSSPATTGVVQSCEVVPEP